MSYWIQSQIGGGKYSKLLTNLGIAIARGGDDAITAVKALAKQGDMIKRFDIDEVKTLVKTLDVDQLKQVEHLIPTSNIRKLDPSELSKLSPNILRKLDPISIGKLDVDNLKRLANFDASTMKRMTPENLKKLDLDTLKRADFDTLKKLDLDTLKKLNLDATTLKRLGIDKKVASKIDDSKKALDDIAEEADETVEAVTKKGNSFLKKHPKTMMLASGAVIGTSVWVGLSINDFNEIQNTEFNITKMEKHKEKDKHIWVTYEYVDQEKEEFEFYPGDWIYLEENDSVPTIPIDKKYVIQEADDENYKCLIKVKTMPITLGNTGKFRYQTTFKNRMKNRFEDIPKEAGGFIKDIFDGLAEGLGIDPSTLKWILIGIAIFVVVIIVGGLIFKFM